VHRRSYVDVLGDDARSAWLCSWQRSGSTWLAEVLASAPGTRLIYEPANLPDRVFRGDEAARIPLPTEPGPELRSVERALRGRVHGPWVDQLGGVHVVRRRVVKDVRAVGLLGIVAARHPTTPIVLLVRHPLSIARSTLRLGWTSSSDGDPDELLLDEVRRWATLHAAALREPSASRTLVVAYEHLVLAPDATLGGVLDHLAARHRTWRDLRIDRARLSAPSSTSFREVAARTPQQWVGTFEGISSSVLDATAQVLEDAGLGSLYGTRPEPLATPDVIATLLR
jgi:hypothetical protein